MVSGKPRLKSARVLWSDSLPVPPHLTLPVFQDHTQRGSLLVSQDYVKTQNSFTSVTEFIGRTLSNFIWFYSQSSNFEIKTDEWSPEPFRDRN